MKNNGKNKILLLLLICMILNACGKKDETEGMISDTEESDLVIEEEIPLPGDLQENIEEQENVDKANVDTISADEQPESAENNSMPVRHIDIVPAEKADISQKVNEDGRALTNEELQLFDELIQESGNYGFLLSVYDTPADANLNEICYNGLGTNKSEITKEEEQAYLKAIGESEIYTDFEKISTAQLNDFLLEKTGLTYEQMNTRLGWTYISEYDAYYSQHGDTNYCMFSCKEGYTADEKTFVLRVSPYDFDAEPDGYHEMDYELTLEKNGETYQFKSNRLIMEEGLIEDQTFRVDLSPVGEVIFASYAPNVDKVPLADVSKNNRKLLTIL